MVVLLYIMAFQGFSSSTTNSMEDLDTVPSVAPTTPSRSLMVLFSDHNHEPNYLLVSHLVSFLPDADKAQMRLVARKCRDYVDLTFFGPVYDPAMQITPFSSEISGGTIGSNIFGLLRSAQSRIIIASDKCTNEEFLDDLLVLPGITGRPLEIRVVTGEDPNTQRTLANPKYGGAIIHQAIPANRDRSGKMHNKFIVVDDALVVTGSPNLTFAAYNYNVESFVAIQHHFVARLYLRYYEYIVSGKNKYDHTQPEYRRVKKMMEVFNGALGNPIQVCLAPIFEIKTFVTRELDSSKAININMFLISRGSTQDDDIIATLLAARRNGAAVTVKVDGNQYHGDARDYMPDSLRPLCALGADVYTVVKHSEKMSTRTKKVIDTRPQFHDKLILIQLADGSKKVFIGSAGFTNNVQDNLNLENMVLLGIPSIYDVLLNHFTVIDASRRNLDVARL